MSLEVNVNITKGWPSPSIVEKSLAAASGTSLAQGDIATVNSSGQWVKAAHGTTMTLNALPFIIMVDSTDPSTNRGSHQPTNYRQLPYGAIHGIGFNNALEIETTNYDTGGTYSVGTELAVGAAANAGRLKVAAAGEVVIGTVTRAPYTLGTKTYLTFVPRENRTK
jgi:hypothetical protein